MKGFQSAENVSNNLGDFSFLEVLFHLDVFCQSRTIKIFADHMAYTLAFIDKQIIGLNHIGMVYGLQNPILVLQSPGQLHLLLWDHLDSIHVASGQLFTLVDDRLAPLPDFLSQFKKIIKVVGNIDLFQIIDVIEQTDILTGSSFRFLFLE